MWDDDALDEATQLDGNEVGFIPAPPPMKSSPSNTDKKE
jgi:hypothetical protein